MTKTINIQARPTPEIWVPLQSTARPALPITDENGIPLTDEADNTLTGQ